MKKRFNLTRVSLLYAALLIWLGMACATVTKVTPAVDITGTWQADIDAPQGKLEIILHVTKSPGGTLTATMDAPAYDAYDVPLIFSFENGVIHYEIEQVQVSFDGKLIDPSTIEGVIIQDGSESGPAIYKRVE
ncbi:MAG: hypothetical protein GH143_08730 [Calditrichaeota bacterium]|nr:hypothetical protein [Calditrichota bacterium]